MWPPSKKPHRHFIGKGNKWTHIYVTSASCSWKTWSIFSIFVRTPKSHTSSPRLFCYYTFVIRFLVAREFNYTFICLFSMEFILASGIRIRNFVDPRDLLNWVYKDFPFCMKDFHGFSRWIAILIHSSIYQPISSTNSQCHLVFA